MKTIKVPLSVAGIDTTVVITQGNPANMSMYETVKHLQMILPGLAKEVFR